MEKALMYYYSLNFDQGEVFKMIDEMSNPDSGAKMVQLAFDEDYETLGYLMAEKIMNACHELQEEIDGAT